MGKLIYNGISSGAIGIPWSCHPTLSDTSSYTYSPRFFLSPHVCSAHSDWDRNKAFFFSDFSSCNVDIAEIDQENCVGSRWFQIPFFCLLDAFMHVVGNAVDRRLIEESGKDSAFCILRPMSFRHVRTWFRASSRNTMPKHSDWRSGIH